MRFSTPCSRIKSSGGDTSSSFFSVADKWPAVAQAEAAAMITPLFLMNSLREDLLMIFIVGFMFFGAVSSVRQNVRSQLLHQRGLKHRSIFLFTRHRNSATSLQ